MFLDQIALQNQCLQLGIRHDILKSGDPCDHLLDFGTLIAAGLKILPHPVLQADRLAHINNGISVIMHNINSRLSRELF